MIFVVNPCIFYRKILKSTRKCMKRKCMKQPHKKNSAIAIIGMGCIFPGSVNLKAFWHLLFNGIDAIEEIPPDTHWQIKDYFDADPSRPDHVYCTRGGFIPKICFDPAAFGIPPNNISATDTAQLLGLEVANMALEDAGYGKDHPFLSTAKVNVILGVTGTQELVIPLGARLGHPIWKKALDAAGISPEQKKQVLSHIQASYTPWQENSFPGLLGNVVAGRIANRFNLSGTNSVSDAACASSLAALHTAVMELTAHKCDMSVTGGVDCLNDIFMHMCFAKTGVLSHSSDARPFSKDADGTVLGEGIGMLVLKRLEDALNARDRIYAVIKGVGTASDGKTSAIYAPEAKGQLKALTDAYHQAGIDPTSVGLVEAHGTGTRVGDKVEFTALKSCFGSPAKKNYTAIGSVKSMIGHTKAAAGAAGIIKAALALHHKVIPPTLKADTPDPDIDIGNSAFYLNPRSRPWVSGFDNTRPRRAGVSAFGFGGSNFHAVLEEHAPEKSHISWDGSVQIAAFSAQDAQSLLAVLADFGRQVTVPSLADEGERAQMLAWQAAESRKIFRCDHPCRLVMVLHKHDDPAEKVAQACDIVKNGAPAQEGPVYFESGPAQGKLGFLFPGQGSQYPDMGKDLFATFPEALEALNLARQIFFSQTTDSLDLEKNDLQGPDRKRSSQTPPLTDPAKPADLADLIFPLPQYLQEKQISVSRLQHTRAAQMAIGAVSLAMTRVLKRFKVCPHITCGHSFGELTAMHAAGWMDDTTLLTLAAVRGSLMAKAGNTGSDSGSMLAVQAPPADIEALIRNLGLDLVLANRNSPGQGVLSGPTPDIDQAGQWCRKHRIRAIKLPVAAAFHSRLVADAAAPFNRFVADQAIAATDTPVLSNTTGKPYDTDEDTIKTVLGHQLMHPVCFDKNIKTMHEFGVDCFVEVGPKTVLSGLTRQILASDPVTAVSLDSSCGTKSGMSDLAKVLSLLAAKGFAVDLTQWEDPVSPPAPKRLRISLCGANPKPGPVDTPPVPKIQPSSNLSSKKSPVHTSTAMNPVETKRPEPSPARQQGPDMQAYSSVHPPASPTKSPSPAENRTFDPGSHPAGSHRETRPSALDAMHLVQKGLEAMQALQAQTARTHEKFLETQTQAGQTLAAMMAQTRRFIIDPQTPAGPDAPIERPDSFPSAQSFSLPVKVNGETPPQYSAAAPSVTAPQLQASPPQAVADHSTKPGVSNSSGGTVPQGPKDAPNAAGSIPETDNKNTVQKVLFDTVSRLTGFPVEMLEPDMDIESDLGIDSIKKVEIISELEKKLPDVSGLTTEHIGTARTLSDICQAIAPRTSETGPLHSPDPISAHTSDRNSDRTADSTPKEAPASERMPPVGPATATDTSLAAPDTLNILVATISELTGFPEQMLEPGMDLESDLGIDSIKRVEILSRLEQALGDRTQGLTQEDMAPLKTIQDMVDFFGQAPVKKNFTHRDDPVKNTEITALVRRKIVLEKTPIHQIRFFNGARIQIAGDKKIYITQDPAGFAGSLKLVFENQGLTASLMDITSGRIPDLADAAGIVIVQDSGQPGTHEEGTAFLKAAFALVHENGARLQTAAREKGAFLATVSFSGGGFGIPPYPFDTHPVYGGLAGLAKTAALEWKEVLCHAIDLPCDRRNACDAHTEAAAALMMTRGPVELGLNGDNCLIPTLVDAPLAKGGERLHHQDVVVITGGARGVTAACAVELARAWTPAIALLGRSPAPSDEPEWARGLSDPGDLKKAILTHAFAGNKPTPADIEKKYQAICANRQIRQTLELIRSHGSQVIYRSTDIRDLNRLKTTLEEVRTRFNAPITGIIHGAGVLEDKLIVDKQPDQFNRVFDTKVAGLDALIQATQTDTLKYLVVFSSIAARTGNPGQCDYAMANEVLNKTMGRLSIENSSCRYLAVNWGPWDGGMVDDSLKQAFAKKGVGLIPVPAGARHLVREMAAPDHDLTEIIITAETKDPKRKKPLVLSQVSQIEISRETVPVITAHRINHAPVVPFALLSEIMAHAAEKNNPGLKVAGLDDMRLLKGVLPENAGATSITLAVNLGKCTRGDIGFTALASLTSSGKAGETRTHATATTVLKNSLPDPPALSAWHRMDLVPCRRTIQEMYDTILFHGRDLQAITTISGISEKGIEVIATRGPNPDHWFETPAQSSWIMDPLLMDAAFQAAIIWTWETRGLVCLPSFLASLRIYSSFDTRRQDPSGTPDLKDDVHILFTVNENTEHRIKGYFTFFNSQRVVVASIMGFEAVVDGSLHRKFKPGPLFDREAILSFAQGLPSQAFGEKYRMFDKDRQIARLPRPPYFFMDRILTADHPQWEMQPGGWIETEYDVPEDAWYFNANHTHTMPLCILMEIALQPCGWLAAYAGSALHSDARLYFRNLGGKARLMGHVSKDAGTLTIQTRMTDVFKAGDMIIQEFDLTVTNRGKRIYQGTTRFGFFTAQALAEQKGIRNTTLALDTPPSPQTPLMVFDTASPLTPDDPATGINKGMPASALCMVDQIDMLESSGGNFGRGYIRATKKVSPTEWFFDAHFYEDPVCPGSLGIESFLQTLRFFLLKTFNIDSGTHTPQLMTDQAHEWIYRGQIIPANQKVTIHTHIREVSETALAYSVTADGALCVDGLPIYEMKQFKVGFVKAVCKKARDQRTTIFVPG
jgi:acyl transferase domain-containing protein/3-hydroxymyristoyl/3-hydroxydecanoyl-(acyl carrier protein) dehydratase/NAD(P)-dependent dehydrogenase (short-subunit alcohol dehydrogenase family)/acyl carrier protein